MQFQFRPGSALGDPMQMQRFCRLAAVYAIVSLLLLETVNADSTRFAVIGDYGSDSANEAAVASQVKSFGPQFIVTTGDNNYTTGATEDWDRTQGKYYRDYIKYPADSSSIYKDNGVSTNQFFPTLGNHDWDAGLYSYTNYFELPGNERYYSFTRGPVECFVLSSDPREPDGRTNGTPQYDWAEAAIRNSTARWQLVFFHHPAYTYQSNHQPMLEMRWPFEEWGVDGVFSGHNHNMQRMNVDGVPYFLEGASGNSLHRISGQPIDAVGQWFNMTKYGFLLVDADDGTLTFQFIDKDGVVLDRSSVPEPSAAAYLILCTATVARRRQRRISRR